MTEWITTPLSGTVSPWLAWIITLVAAGMMLLASLWLKSPGPLTAGERRRLTSVVGRWTPFRGAGRFLLPAFLLFSLWQLTFPLGRPTTVVLVSRSLPWLQGRPEARPHFEAAWNDHYRDARDVWRRRVPFEAILDAGPLVDGVCAGLEDPSRWWRPGSESRQRVRSSLEQVLTSERIKASLDPPLPPARSPDASRCRNLPRWLVESVEISVLKALTLLRNCRRIVFVRMERSTSAGLVWAGVEPYLASGSRAGGEATERGPAERGPGFSVLPAAGVSEDPPLRILDLRQVKESGGSLSLTALLAGTVAAADAVDYLRLRGGGDYAPPSACTEVDPGPRPAPGAAFEVRLRCRLPEPSATGSRLCLVTEDGTSWRCLARAGPSIAAGRNRVFLTSPGAARDRWRATLSLLASTDRPDLPASIGQWANAMGKLSLDPADLESQAGVPAPGPAARAAVCVETYDLGVWVYPCELGSERPATAAWRPAPTWDRLPRSFLRFRTTPIATPGVYSLEGLPLAPDRLAVAEGGCAVAHAQFVPDVFYAGTLRTSRPDASLIPVVTRHRVGARAVATHFGFDFARQGMLLDRHRNAPGDEPFTLSRLLAGWSQLFEAIRYAAANAEDDGCQRTETSLQADDHPAPCLDRPALERLRGRSLGRSIAAFAAALALYSAYLLVHLQRRG